MCFSMSASCSSRRAASKVPPQFCRAAAQGVVSLFVFVERQSGHVDSLTPAADDDERRDDHRHRRLARWTLPIWLFVSVSGVIVYLMLYQLEYA